MTGDPLPVIREDHGTLCVLTLNRPEQINAISPELALLLRSHIDEIAARDDIACVILRGSGRGFCAGYDLKARERARAMLPPDFIAETINAIAALPQPVIACVHGHCITGGLELALAADFIVAADTARFADTHARWDMRAAWGLTQRLPRRIGVAAAKDMMFSGREVGGTEAVALGLATRCVPQDALEETVLDIGKTIAQRSTEVIRWIKHQVDHGTELPLRDALAHERANRPAAATQATTEKLKATGWAQNG